MSKQQKTAISPTREENYPEWYQQVIKSADLAENAAVRGCMVIKPWGYAIWERMQQRLDTLFKQTGHENFYCPLFIPLSFLEKEAQHVEGFAKECAVVTHHRLKKDDKGKLIPTDPLDEPLIVRPTSEAIIGECFSRWVQSYRDLPLLMNQWANVVRWEMRTRLFLRTTEFLWQEGHTAHATSKEAEEEALRMVKLYAGFMEEYLAIPVIVGEKSAAERFPGADITYTTEMMMQDKKALQAGTSHFLGQNFAKAFDITFQDQQGNEVHAWTTSWGVTTRMIGGLIMSHGDDDGLICPPKVAPKQIVIVPIIHKPHQSEAVTAFCEKVADALKSVTYHGEPLRICIDKRELRSGEKCWSWVKKGVPLRIEIGQREMEENQLTLSKRINPYKQKEQITLEKLLDSVIDYLEEIHATLINRVKSMHETSIKEVHTKEELYQYFQSNDKVQGFAKGFFADDVDSENQLNQDLNVSVRVFPLEASTQTGQCILTGKRDAKLAIFGKAY